MSKESSGSGSPGIEVEKPEMAKEGLSMSKDELISTIAAANTWNSVSYPARLALYALFALDTDAPDSAKQDLLIIGGNSSGKMKVLDTDAHHCVLVGGGRTGEHHSVAGQDLSIENRKRCLSDGSAIAGEGNKKKKKKVQDSSNQWWPLSQRWSASSLSSEEDDDMVNEVAIQNLDLVGFTKALFSPTLEANLLSVSWEQLHEGLWQFWGKYLQERNLSKAEVKALMLSPPDPLPSLSPSPHIFTLAHSLPQPMVTLPQLAASLDAFWNYFKKKLPPRPN